jgi:hypothetical protein
MPIYPIIDDLLYALRERADADADGITGQMLTEIMRRCANARQKMKDELALLRTQGNHITAADAERYYAEQLGKIFSGKPPSWQTSNEHLTAYSTWSR